MDWRHRAACRDEDPELFFPIGNTGPALLQIEEARAVCRRCEVVDTCLTWALESGQDAGVWGAMSEDERRALKRRTARNRARTAQPQRLQPNDLQTGSRRVRRGPVRRVWVVLAGALTALAAGSAGRGSPGSRGRPARS